MKKNKKKRKLGRIVFVVSAILTFLLATKSYFHYNFVRAVIFGVFCIFSVFMATVGATLKQKFILKKIAEDRNENIEINVDMHNCEACLALFNDSDKIEYLRKNIHKYASDVILKYNVKQKNTEKNEK